MGEVLEVRRQGIVIPGDDVMKNIDELDDQYVLRGRDRSFSTGRKSNLRYALMSETAYLTELNAKGPEPFEYLDYAKANLASGSAHGCIDALGHAKRAVHLTMDGLLRVWGLDEAYGKAKFPQKLDIMSEADAFPTRLIGKLNSRRNLMEHRYESVKKEDAADFVGIAEMFLLLAFPFIRKGVTGAIVGVDGDDRCLEWRIDHRKNEMQVLEVHGWAFWDTPIGRIFHASSPDSDRSTRVVVEVRRHNAKDWMPFLDLFVYLTKRLAVKLPPVQGDFQGLVGQKHTLQVFPAE